MQPLHLISELLPAPSSRERTELTSPSRKKVASVGERHMSGLHREPCAWQEKAMPIPAPAFHSCCNSHKRLLKPKKNKTVILIKQHSGTLKTRWRLLRPTLKLYSLFQKLQFLCAGWMDAVGLTPGSTVMWYFSRKAQKAVPAAQQTSCPQNIERIPHAQGLKDPSFKKARIFVSKASLLFQVT